MTKKIIYTGVILAVTIFLVVLFVSLNFFFCGAAREIVAYASIQEESYYYGSRSCPVTRTLNRLDLEEIKKKGTEGDFRVITNKEDEKIEKLLREQYLGFDKINISGTRGSFVVYEVSCGACGEEK